MACGDSWRSTGLSGSEAEAGITRKRIGVIDSSVVLIKNGLIDVEAGDPRAKTEPGRF